MNIAEILKNVSAGTKLYSTIHGYVTFIGVDTDYGDYPITVRVDGLCIAHYTSEGYYLYDIPNSEPILFPSKEQRDWSKFSLDLPKGTPVVIFESVCRPFTASIRRYAGGGRYAMLSGDTRTYSHIVPFDKIEIKDGEFIFDDKDNYGSQRKEDEA